MFNILLFCVYVHDMYVGAQASVEGKGKLCGVSSLIPFKVRSALGSGCHGCTESNSIASSIPLKV